MSDQHNAFTLIELLIVMAVIVILMGIGLLGGRFVIKRAHKTEHQAVLAGLVKATEAYNLDNGGYPEIGMNADRFGSITQLTDSYESAGYLDVDFTTHHGEAGEFYYMPPTSTRSFYFCVQNRSDDYVVCEGPGVPASLDDALPKPGPNNTVPDWLAEGFYH